MQDRKAEKLTEMSGNFKVHMKALSNIIEVNGLASLQHTLKLATIVLRHIPEYGCRELLIVYGSLHTCDPGDIFETIDVRVVFDFCILYYGIACNHNEHKCVFLHKHMIA
jgi:transcription initiation factor TFIIH subunit 2